MTAAWRPGSARPPRQDHSRQAPGLLELSWIDDETALALLAERGNWRQYPAYARAAADRVGARSSYCRLCDQGTPIAVANLRTRRLPLTGAQSSLISHGPALLRDPHLWAADLAACLDTFAAHFAQQAHEIRIDPDVRWQLHAAAPSDLARPPAGHVPGDLAGYRTIVLSLAGGLDGVRSRMDPKWRADLRRAEANGLQVQRTADPVKIMEAEPLLASLAARKGFKVPQDVAFFAQAARAAKGPERFLAHLIYRDDALLGAHVGAFSGDTAVYLLGANTAEGRSLRASYLAQWAAIRTAAELGLSHYDLGGIDPSGNPDVYRFKRRMGGQEVATPGPYLIEARGLRGKALGAARALWQARKRFSA